MASALPSSIQRCVQGDLSSPSPPAEKATASQDQAGQSCAKKN